MSFIPAKAVHTCSCIHTCHSERLHMSYLDSLWIMSIGALDLKPEVFAAGFDSGVVGALAASQQVSTPCSCSTLVTVLSVGPAQRHYMVLLSNAWLLTSDITCTWVVQLVRRPIHVTDHWHTHVSCVKMCSAPTRYIRACFSQQHIVTSYRLHLGAFSAVTP